MSGTALSIAAWLLTYALHSTVLLGIAALLTARWVRGEAWRETLWKAALIGGLVTATAQSAGWIVGDMGRWRLAVLPAASASVSPGTPHDAAGADPSPPVSSVDPDHTITPLNEEAALEAAPPPSPAAAPAPSRAPKTPLGWAMLAWGLGAAGMLARLALRQARLRSLLAGRTRVEDDAVLAMLAGLRRNAGIWRPVQLTTCAAAPTPLALGGGEICVPPRFLTDLDPEQQRSALAHELAHVARRDPAWHFGVSILEALFFFQPLNRLARARLRESAEFLCDEWAARQTGSPLGLARCLAEVASWVAPGRHPIPAGTMAMAEGGSPLVQRVQRLAAWRGEPREGSGLLRVAAAVVLIGAVAAIAPAIASTDHARDPHGASGGSSGSSSADPLSTSAPADESRQDIVVIPHPAPGQPLAQRWAWAVEEMGRRRLERAWVAWSIPTPLSPGPTWLAGGSGGERMMVNRRLGAPADQTMMLFTVARDGQLEHAVGHSAEVDLSRRPVLWLGPARGDESFAQLRRMADGLRDPDQREHLVEAVGIHQAEGVVPYLAAVLGRDGSNGVRREAAYALGRHRSGESLAALRTAVERDGSEDVRREAVEAISRLRVSQSGAALHDLALRGADAVVRRAAVEALGKDLDAQGMRTLTAIASLDRDPVAHDAVEAMEHGPAELAAPALARIAWTGGNREAARQAAESLGRLPAPWAVAALDSIARLHTDPVIARQAVESLGGYPEAAAGGYIRQIARTHRDARVREEALDQLAEGRGESEPDPEADGEDPDADLDPGSDPDPDPDPGDPDPGLRTSPGASAAAASAARAGAIARP